MTRQKYPFVIGCALALCVLMALPAAAADDVIYNGIDIWTTPADGATFLEFSAEPIPAGFFCSRSAPFTGRIALRGVPIVTANEALGHTDTIVQRLDDAVFNEKGVATTRVQLRVLQLQSIAPIQTACGRFNAAVSLDGMQPITRMRIVRENDKGGRYLVPIAVRAKVSFSPVNGTARERLEVSSNVRFKPNSNDWSFASRSFSRKSAFVLVDTDGDGRTDTFLPGPSNFEAGVSQDKPISPCDNCHWDLNKGRHCMCIEPPPA